MTSEDVRPYDVVLYGASGFVGRQMAAYFARHATGVRWAIAGRDRGRLEAVRDALGVDVDVLVADAHDQRAVDAIASRARVILTAAGPFARYGDALVDACVRLRTHYADITGETTWARTVIERCHERAAESGTRIVPFCGFDSVPADLGAMLVAEHVHRALGVPCERASAFFRMAGGLNGGTVATALDAVSRHDAASAADPFLLDPPEARHRDPERHRDPRTPMLHPDIGAWTAPYAMGSIDTRVVRRSAALQEAWGRPYGRDFAFQEYLEVGVGPLAALRAIGVSAATALGAAALRRPALRPLLASVLPRPGTGPSAARMEAGWYVCRLVGEAADGRRVRGVFRGSGDPANRATVLFACEAALGLAFGGEALPGGPGRGGVLTPATALGNVLVDRLRRTGVTIEMSA